MGGSNDVILSQSTSSVAATISASVSRTDPSSRQATPAPLSILPSRLSVDDSDVNATLSRLQAEQLQLQIQQLPPPPITEEQLRIHNQRRYLRKFMCLIATLPVVATLAIYNKIELAMLWWVIVLPVIGISVALYLNRKLGQRLEYLQEQAQTSRRSLLTASRATRFSSSNSDGRDELATPSPPPDYQSSIITPPAYITAQQPRKVPSYRSLENLFSRARQGVTARTSRRGSESSAVVILAGTTEQDAQQQQQDCLQYRVLTIAEEHSDVANTSSSTFDTSSSNDHRQQDLGKSIQETITITLRNAPEMVEIRSAWQNHLSAGCSHGASSSSPSNTSASVMVMTRSSSSNTTNIELTTDSITDPKGKRPVRE
ncbi:hypothetical protein EDD11_002688 [Mortierella claussenii]|nr:hypothetical protein EDD11_002688 [Mortierella claussenii]